MYFSLKAFSGSIYCRYLELYLNLRLGYRLRTRKEFSGTKAELFNANTSMRKKAECPSARSMEMLENTTSVSTL